ncbi:polysaccharide lyase family 4, domain III-domain-containing protein [Elsinoe ampelina]|uniref:rhamnogalacturonan endolyase n=1 Tax=Elsinoe ampelina TaxID=302913 RepID=A0A6A6GQ72_9PEZI|nr:polysaccharide lyase family 4, domain III-domain-containing protein [Elsinoe ampelina]
MFSLLAAGALLAQTALAGPFLTQLNTTTWVIGNDLWNMTQNEKYGTKLWYKGKDLVGNAVGHYTSYNGARNDLAWTSAKIALETEDYIDVQFDAVEGEMHWVIWNDLPGAYQYFVNRALPNLGEFRTLWRLDNETFPRGRTDIKDGILPALADAFIRTQDYYGVYGPEFGSWYINPGKDYYNGDHLKQELMIHRESQTGDAVQLNMIHGTHFQASSNDAFADGKLWGPWLWYLNDGSLADAAARSDQESADWPYAWFQDEGYRSRVRIVSGSLTLSDGRPAAGAAVFLGDSDSNLSSLDQGKGNYYTTYADGEGRFVFPQVLTGIYGLQAWANGGAIGDVLGRFVEDDIDLSTPGEGQDLGELVWQLPEGRKRIFQVGASDRRSLGFKYGGAPYEHGLVAKCPANLTFTVGQSATEEWCFGQSALGTWSIAFDLGAEELTGAGNRSALLSVSLAGYSQGTSSSIFVNGGQGGSAKVGNLTTGSIPSDQCLYRSATQAGEWHFFEFPVARALLKEGRNTVSFIVERTTLWRGFLWDSIVLEWV